jgi:Amt family ammonium transporter
LGTGILMSSTFGGVGYAENVTMMGQLTTQAIAVGTTILWTGIISVILYKVVDAVVGLRVPEESEREGLDATQHGEAAYHL